MATHIALLQHCQHIHCLKSLKFVILIGGIPPHLDDHPLPVL
jgi:hypothetical protein